MRNPVAKNDFNRSAVHPDRSKRPQNTVDEGLLDFYAENAENVAQEEYGRVVGMTPEDSYAVPMTPEEIISPGEAPEKKIGFSTQRKKFPGLLIQAKKKLGEDLRPVQMTPDLDDFFSMLEDGCGKSFDFRML